MATNIEQHVANLSIFVAHFGVFEPNLYYEIENWKYLHFLMLCCENFGSKALLKLNIENSINILALKLNEIDARGPFHKSLTPILSFKMPK